MRSTILLKICAEEMHKYKFDGYNDDRMQFQKKVFSDDQEKVAEYIKVRAQMAYSMIRLETRRRCTHLQRLIM